MSRDVERVMLYFLSCKCLQVSFEKGYLSLNLKSPEKKALVMGTIY